MRPVTIILILLPFLLVGYCALPLTSVVSIIIHLTDQNGKPVQSKSTGKFLDGAGKTVTEIEGKRFVMEDFAIQWWASSRYPQQSHLTPDDALRVKSVEIAAEGCKPQSLPVTLTQEYNGLSFMPHGGGPAYMYYTFEPTVKLECR